MIDPSEYVVTEDDTISDVDLDIEVVRLKDGRRLTNELAERLVEETLVDVRYTRAAAEQRAAEKGVSLSELVREALEHYLTS